MSDVPQHPAGWYPDPQNPAIVRWWDGYRWTEAWHPAPAAAPAPPAQQAPAQPAPAQPVAPVPAHPPAPAFEPPATAFTAPPLPPAPAYPAPATISTVPTSADAPRRDIASNTVWIWLVVFLPVLNLASYFLLDWRGYIEDVVRTSTQPGGGTETWMLSWTAGSLALTAFGYVVIAAQIVFAFLDWRTLRSRGVDKPFHWAWIFLTLVVTNGVYVIGRGVVLRRRTGAGLAPVWAWIAVTAISWIVGIVFAIVLINEVFAILAQEGLVTP